MLDEYRKCIEACYLCAAACDNCAASCLKEENLEMMRECIKRGVGDAQLAADFRHGRAQFSLLQGKDNLLFGES